MWPEKDIPEEYLTLAKRLVGQPSVTEREFVDLCMLAVKYIKSGNVRLYIRSDMALYIANIWLGHKNISDSWLLDEIGGQFGEWEIPGTFVIDDELHKPYWEMLRQWIADADK